MIYENLDEMQRTGVITARTNTESLEGMLRRGAKVAGRLLDPFQDTVPCWQRAQVKAAAAKLFNACDHMRPRAEGDTLLGIPPNAEALAISLMTRLSVELIMSLSRQS